MVRFTMLLLAVLVAKGCLGDPNLVQNGDFTAGAGAWHLVAGPYGAKTREGASHARVLAGKGQAGGAALLLDATGLASEVDAYSMPMSVVAGHGYRLGAWVRRAGVAKDYKVTIDWQDGAGKHLAYANDWAGNDRPTTWVRHGGIFAAPTGAAQAVVILGTQPGGAFLFGAVSLEHVGVCEPLEARPRRDGDGSMAITGPVSVPAGGYATWRATYTCGPSGLPSGGLISVRRSPWNTDWSDPQGTRPSAQGYVSVSGPAGSIFRVERGSAGVLLVRLLWPTLLPGDKVRIVIGDRSGGSPGMRVQRKPARLRWYGGSDCTGKGDYLDLGRTEAGPLDIAPGPGSAIRVLLPAVMAVGEPYDLRVEMVDRFGNVARMPAGAPFLPRVTGIRAVRVDGVKTDDGRAVARFKCSVDRLGAVAVRAVDWGLAGFGHSLATAGWSLPVRTDGGRVAPRSSVGAVWMDNGLIAAALPRSADGWGAVVLFARQAGRWQRVAAAPTLAMVQFGAGRWKASQPVPGIPVRFRRPTTRVRGRSCDLDLWGQAGGVAVRASLSLSPGSKSVQCRLEVDQGPKLAVGVVHAPMLGVGDGSGGDRLAGGLFPGLEFLGPDETSSDVSGVGWAISERRVPDPYKITVPLMAVATRGCVAGLAWDPTQRWCARSSTPLARFESPNPRQANHLMSLAVPGRSQGMPENEVSARSGDARRGSYQLTFEMFALADTEDSAAATEWWVRTHGLPPVRHPRSWAAEAELCGEALTRTCWVEGVGGWFTAVGLKPGYVPDYVYRMHQLAAAVTDHAMASKLTSVAGRAMETAGGPAGVGPQMLLGDPEKAIAGLRSAAYGRMAQQRPDGGWAFADVYGRQGARATLADPDDQELGSCVTALDPVLTYAVATGDPAAAKAGLRGLDRLAGFSKPAGAESWEVPFACPNLRAAALACRCYLRGYQLTGKAEPLARARRWAYAGLSFVALTQAADRPVMPGATISVMGTTFWDQGWFGWPVQWVGLVYAEVLQEFARFDASFDWMRVASLVLASAERQQKPMGAACKHVGMYPDSYSLLTGRDSYEWCLGPSGLVGVLLGTRGYACEPCVLSVGRPDAPVRGFSTATQVGAGAYQAGTLLVRLRSPAGSTATVVLFGVTTPGSVTWAGQPLGPMVAGGNGWRPGAVENALVLRLPFSADEGLLVLRGTAPSSYREPRPMAGLVYGTFEDGHAGWELGVGAAVVQGEAYEGRSALASDSLGGLTEGQATSEPFGVKEGRRYRLSCMVKQVSGDGEYKVTVEWLGGGERHLQYDNDWAGTDHPTAFTVHGGVFVAPPGATGVRLILGTRRCQCLFDAVAFTPLP